MVLKLLRSIITILPLFFLLIITLPSNLIFATETNRPGEYNSRHFDHLHTNYDQLLKRYVHNANVDYKGFISSSEQFDTYLKRLGSVSEEDYSRWSREEKLAYWINAYNAFTIKAVIDNYPIKRTLSIASVVYPKNSIRQINGVWDRPQFLAIGKMVSLNDIEHNILRKEFKEPRIHFAIVCASVGCPDLMAEAYVAHSINGQLESQAVKFVNNSTKGSQIDTVEKTIKLSKIFNWFGEDFIDKNESTELFKGRSAKQRAVLNFVKEHITSEEEKKFMEGDNFKISYLDYDWSLNEFDNADLPATN